MEQIGSRTEVSGQIIHTNRQPGTIIFFDWEQDGETDHVGIVQKCENGVVYTVEGNSGDSCRTKTYSVGSGLIYGYGIRHIKKMAARLSSHQVL